MWAVVMAIVAMLAAAASSRAASGGLGESAGPAACTDHRYGDRELYPGACGEDVATLNWLLASAVKQGRSSLGSEYTPRTERKVKRFQRREALSVTGVADATTQQLLRAAMRSQRATWYGPGFFGNRTACGQKLKPGTVGVAHKRLPCGTKVTIHHEGSFLRTRVIDRGPYAHGAKWDLTNGARKHLGFTITEDVGVAVVR